MFLQIPKPSWAPFLPSSHCPIPFLNLWSHQVGLCPVTVFQASCSNPCSFWRIVEKRWNSLQSRQSNILIGHESKVTFEHQTQVKMHKFKPSLNFLWNLWASPYLPYSQCRNAIKVRQRVAHWCRTHGPSVSPLFSLWYLSLCLALWCAAHPPRPTH